ncbi:SIS domain-containing protein [Solirhodobacter olei]|uniref:SIS domain-containing protein n=1 Tax=Solirhodobacter olei TaxID=2493082 RepID=UPI000FDC7AE4|nr:SIS domain-containing protein [Solirhodobacter olei]
MTAKTHMRREIEEIPAIAAHFLDTGRPALAAAGAALRELDPRFVVSVARGSSDHAATYLKYAIELMIGVPVASIGPSIASIYGARMRLERAACIGISQSGRSPDIVAMMRAAGQGGALPIAITNDRHAPISEEAAHTLALHAGRERSVAATKTFVTSVLAGLALLAEWSGDDDLRRAVATLPIAFEQALTCDWTPLADRLVRARSLYVLGRGPSFAIASEMALKFKETCDLHAEGYSSAEVLHGPAAIVNARFPVLALGVQDAALQQATETVTRLVGQGADAFFTGPEPVSGATALPAVQGLHPLVAPLVLVVSFYIFVEELARRRGLNPDIPQHLRKVTETV